MNLQNSENELKVLCQFISSNSKEEVYWTKFTFKCIFHVERIQKRNMNTKLNYFTRNSFTELIDLFISLALYMHMQKCE